MSDDVDQTSSGHRSKVSRVIDTYELDGFGDRLEASWRGDDEVRRSLRELADYLNRSVLTAAMQDVDLRPLDGEVDNMYRLLTDDDVSGGQQAEAEAKLERAGLDPEELRTDFVSHQAVHTFLTKHRDAEPPSTSSRNRSGTALDTVQRTKGRLESVVEGTLSDLERRDELTLGSTDVIVAAQVYCEDCQSQYEAAELLDRGGCDCD